MMNTQFEEKASVLAMSSEALIRAANEAFSTMLGVRLQVMTGSGAMPRAHQELTIAGVIGWAGPWSGTGLFECSAECACHIANLMLGSNNAVPNEEVLDAVGEMANVIYGGMKTRIEESLGYMRLGTPTVVCGNDVVVRNRGACFEALSAMFDEYPLRLGFVMMKTGSTAQLT